MPSSGFTPSSRCEAASGPAVLLPGTQHPCLKVRIGPLHTQQEAGETKKPREGDVLNAETHHQELQASRLCTQPWKRVPAFFQSPGIASESRGHSAPNRMCPASRVINLWFRADRRGQQEALPEPTAADKVSVGLPAPYTPREPLLRKGSRGKGFL